VYAGAGLRQLPQRSLQLFETLHASRGKRLVLLALPAAVPSLAVALRVGTAYSILVTVVAEFLMQTGGLGAMLAVTMQQFNLHRAFGASLLAMALSTALYEAGSALEERVRRYFA
jgi:ABC-type nitrate/sulfonate/bicarbonate transport system permease component